MKPAQRAPPGFRCSAIDAAVLAIAPIATWWLWPHLGAMAGVIPFAVGHFFLFCNVFRVHRTQELLWAGAAVVNVGVWTISGHLWWPGILLAQTPLTVVAIGWEIRGPTYHGVGWQWKNQPTMTTPDPVADALPPPSSDTGKPGDQVAVR